MVGLMVFQPHYNKSEVGLKVLGFLSDYCHKNNSDRTIITCPLNKEKNRTILHLLIDLLQQTMMISVRTSYRSTFRQIDRSCTNVGITGTNSSHWVIGLSRKSFTSDKFILFKAVVHQELS